MSCPDLEPIEHPAKTHYVLNVAFEASDGSRRSAIGGGASREDAIAFARESIPGDRHWRVIRLNDLYGA